MPCNRACDLPEVSRIGLLDRRFIVAQSRDVQLPALNAGLAVRIGTLALLGLLGTASFKQFMALRSAAAWVRKPTPCPVFERRLDQARVRVLILGDSTGAGVGADMPCSAVGGLLAKHHLDVDIVNISEPGARVADLHRQIDAYAAVTQPFDLALLHVGGNDILRSRQLASIEQQADEVLARLGRIARHVVWLGPGDVGAAPLFVPPFSWWLSRRTALAANRFERAAKRAGADFIAFHQACHTRVLAADRQRYFALDGLHPSSECYAYCYRQMLQSNSLRNILCTSGDNTMDEPASATLNAFAGTAVPPTQPQEMPLRIFCAMASQRGSPSEARAAPASTDAASVASCSGQN